MSWTSDVSFSQEPPRPLSFVVTCSALCSLPSKPTMKWVWESMAALWTVKLLIQAGDFVSIPLPQKLKDF